LDIRHKLGRKSQAELEGHVGRKQRAARSRRQPSRQMIDTVDVAKEKGGK
jgi:hypothetical protein